jgi:hypothetical protein
MATKADGSLGGAATGCDHPVLRGKEELSRRNQLIISNAFSIELGLKSLRAAEKAPVLRLRFREPRLIGPLASNTKAEREFEIQSDTRRLGPQIRQLSQAGARRTLASAPWQGLTQAAPSLLVSRRPDRTRLTQKAGAN